MKFFILEKHLSDIYVCHFWLYCIMSTCDSLCYLANSLNFENVCQISCCHFLMYAWTDVAYVHQNSPEAACHHIVIPRFVPLDWTMHLDIKTFPHWGTWSFKPLLLCEHPRRLHSLLSHIYIYIYIYSGCPPLMLGIAWFLVIAKPWCLLIFP